MIVAIMQPYLFPYIGYFQLMAAVDTFVFYDDVQYMKGGWVNRNRILHQGAPAWMTLPVVHADHRADIAQRHYTADTSVRAKLVDRVRVAYRGAVMFDNAIRHLEAFAESPVTSVAAANAASLKAIAAEFGIDARFISASTIGGHRHLAGQARVLAMCKELGATTYVNAAGGVLLYDERAFIEAGVELRFLQHALPAYEQFGQPFCPGLSVLDVMMFNDRTAIRHQLSMARTITPDEARAS
ncbi:hypothetical protein ABIE56_001179 [Luteibacter sp. 621]|jgi:hypothetical protein|uniref:WbqC family protein n=1 Tax=Luteibacter sp. 621 TaxID=3373916 RepID=UPI003D246EE1